MISMKLASISVAGMRVALLPSAHAEAAATETWVSGTGSDNNTASGYELPSSYADYHLPIPSGFSL